MSAVATVNRELLTRTLAYVRTHPGEWNQNWWRSPDGCRTKHCFAGWAVTLAGVDWQAAESVGVGYAARDALGLSDAQARGLFAYWNTLDDLERGVELVLAGWDGVELWDKLAARANAPEFAGYGVVSLW